LLEKKPRDIQNSANAAAASAEALIACGMSQEAEEMLDAAVRDKEADAL
jgi:hypothetical protein